MTKMLPVDKANHAVAGAYAAALGAFGMVWIGDAAGAVIPLAAAAALAGVIAAAARELYGLLDGRPFDLADFGATLLGAVPVVLVAW